MQATDSTPNVQVFDDAEAVARAAARRIARLASESIAARGTFSVALSGGSTPKAIFELLAADEFRTQIAWRSVHVFFGDERTVAPDHADSNYRMAKEAMLARVPLPDENVHRINGVGDAAANASEYESDLRAFLGDSTWPRLDLVMLGMGDDGHTASLFPETTALKEERQWVAANWVEKFNTWRITLTAPAINAARNVLFLITGAGKADRLREVLKGERETSRLPSQLIAPSEGALEWFVDRAAAAKL
ncbi:MAG: 6-phosphogluconolactonase [Rubrivivax sp.]|nr:6-phosphogluconolactonase [Pyrinomonadaceae bacterium]